jgi:hypothetical protein
VVLNILGVRGFDPSEIAVKRDSEVATLTGPRAQTKSVEKTHNLGVRAYIPKDMPEEIIPMFKYGGAR